MSNDSIRMLNTLIEIVSLLPIGTNLALLHLMWAMVSGQFLASRGAVFPALAQLGLSDKQVRRAGQALRCGGWSIGQILVRWQGNCMSIIKNFKEITFIPSRLQSFGVCTHLGGFFLIKQIKGNMS